MTNLDEKVYIFGHKSPDTDTICSAIALADFYNQAGFPNYTPARLGELNNETKFVLKHFGLDTPELITDGTDKKIILVDHNEKGQSIDNRDKAEILEIIDHHRISDLDTPKPLYMTVQPVGCTSTMIAVKYLQNNLRPSTAVAGAMISAIISDTLNFTSPTCTQEDITVALLIGEMAGLMSREEIETYGKKMLEEGASLEGFTLEEILGIDRKPFTFGTVKAFVSQVFTTDAPALVMQKKELQAEMDKHLNHNEAQLSVLVVTGVNDSGSTVIVAGSASRLAREAFGMDGDEKYLEGVLSRKTQIVPPLTKVAS